MPTPYTSYHHTAQHITPHTAHYISHITSYDTTQHTTSTTYTPNIACSCSMFMQHNHASVQDLSWCLMSSWCSSNSLIFWHTFQLLACNPTLRMAMIRATTHTHTPTHPHTHTHIAEDHLRDEFNCMRMLMNDVLRIYQNPRL